MMLTRCDAGHDLHVDVAPDAIATGLNVTCLSPACPMTGIAQFRYAAQFRPGGPNPLLWGVLGAIAGGVIAGPRGALIGGALAMGGAAAKEHLPTLPERTDPGVL